MPWYAQRDDLPDTHTMYADPGSQLEAVLTHLGYVAVPAPGADQPDDTGDKQPNGATADDLVTRAESVEALAEVVAPAKPRGGRRA